jgi:hypothetical protein
LKQKIWGNNFDIIVSNRLMSESWKGRNQEKCFGQWTTFGTFVEDNDALIFYKKIAELAQKMVLKIVSCILKSINIWEKKWSICLKNEFQNIRLQGYLREQHD